MYLASQEAAATVDRPTAKTMDDPEEHYEIMGPLSPRTHPPAIPRHSASPASNDDNEYCEIPGESPTQVDYEVVDIDRISQ